MVKYVIATRFHGMLKVFTLLSGFYLAGCGTENDKDNVAYQDIVLLPTEEDTTPSNVPFYPYLQYLEDQLKYIDTTPLAIEKIVVLDGKIIDSTFSSKQELRMAVNPFTDYDPNLPANRVFYKETSFKDLTINRITFSISARKPGLNLQQVNILMDPEKQKVKNLVIKQQFETSDSSKNVHMVWTDKMHMQVSENITLKKGETYTRVTRWVWDKPID
jgi:hypothetical protein